MPNSEESKRVLSEVIKRQMAILGPDITLAKVKNVAGLEIDSAGNVINVSGDTQEVLQNLINQFVELSGLIVKKTMESVIMGTVSGAQIAAVQTGGNISLPISQQPPVSDLQAGAPHTPEGYNIGGQQNSHPVAESNTQPAQNIQPQVIQADQPPQNPDLVEANRDIEDLNKMLSNLNFNGSQSGNNS